MSATTAEEDKLISPAFDKEEGQAISQAAPGTFDRELDQVLASGSVQEAPGDPKELIAAPSQGAGAGAPAPESIVGPADYGPPAPQPATDAILAKLPPAPPTEPAPAPGTVMPDGSPVVPVTPEGVNDKKAALDKTKAEDDILAADDARATAHTYQKNLDDALKLSNDTLASKQAIHDKALAKYNGMQMRDYYDAPEHSRVAAAIAIALGGIGAAFTSAGGGSSENHVLTQINAKIDNDYRQQRANIEKARDSVVMAQTGIQDAKEAKAAALEDLSAKHIATKGAMEQEARFQLAQRGVPAAQIDSDTRVLALGAARRQAEIDARKRQQEEAMQAGRLHLMGAEADAAEARAALAAKKAKGGGAGGGAGSAGKYQALTEALQKSGGELTPEVAAVADKLKIKGTELRGMATQFKQERKVDIQERGEVAKDIKDWADKSQFTAQSKKAIELEKLGRVLQGDKVTGLDRAIVLQEMEKAAKGGTATMGGVELDMAHLAGGTDKLNQIVEKWKDGDFSSKQSQSLMQSIKNQADEAKNVVSGLHDDFQQTFRDNPRYAADPKAAAEVNAKADAYFSQHGFSRKAAKGADAGAAGPTKTAPVKPPTMIAGNVVYRLQPDGTYK